MSSPGHVYYVRPAVRLTDSLLSCILCFVRRAVVVLFKKHNSRVLVPNCTKNCTVVPPAFSCFSKIVVVLVVGCAYDACSEDSFWEETENPF